MCMYKGAYCVRALSYITISIYNNSRTMIEKLSMLSFPSHTFTQLQVKANAYST